MEVLMQERDDLVGANDVHIENSVNLSCQLHTHALNPMRIREVIKHRGAKRIIGGATQP